MSKEITKDEVILHKKASIKTLNQMLEYFINSKNPNHLKKANLLSYWFENFSNYILKEEQYSPIKQINYKRGDVIKVNFGFNVGKEYGGLHYAIVIDKNNVHSSHVVTVVPLTSGTLEDTHPNDVYLGTELYSKLSAKHTSLLNKHNEELINIHATQIEIQDTLNLLKETTQNNSVEDSDETKNTIEKKLLSLAQLNQDYIDKHERLEKYIEMIKKSDNELFKLKKGSIALIGQITTIDKSRIYIPRKTSDVLYGISFSEEKMESINEALKKQYIF